MKHYLMAFALLLSLTLGMMACKENEPDPQPRQRETTLNVASCSITEGAYVDALRTTSVTIMFGNGSMIKLSNRPVTLNGTTVTPKMNGAWTGIEIALALEAEKDYELIIPEGAVSLYKDTTRVNPEFKLHFNTKEGEKPKDPVISAAHLVAAMGFGWNLGNHFDSGDLAHDHQGYPWGWWDKAEPTEALYDSLVSYGIKTLRMPVTWGNEQGYGPTYTINVDYMADVKKNVDWALSKGMYVLVNTHHDEYWQDAVKAVGDAALCDSIEDRIIATWQQIANIFKDYDDEHLIFETFNEIHDEAWGWGSAPYSSICTLVEKWNQIAVDVIRKSGGNNATRWIGVPGFCASPWFTDGRKHLLKLPNDPANKIMVAVHSYDPFEFCTEGSRQQWGHTYQGNDNDENSIKTMFTNLKEQFIDKGVPCYVGEFGAVTRKSQADEPYRSYFLEYFCRTAYFAGIPVMLWDNNNNTGTGGGGECFWYINHANGVAFQPELVKLMQKAATSTSENYTVQNVYDRAPKL